MGKASKWFRGLLGLNKKPADTNLHNKPPKTKWNIIKQKYHHNTYTEISHPLQKCVDSDTHAAELAAFAAVQAAAEVVGMTSSRRYVSINSGVDGKGADYGGRKEEWAVIKIQSHFRAYLARRALRALKALVKIQALVRGYIVRKRTSDSIRRVQALLRLRARARVRGSQILEYSYSPLKNTPSRRSSRSSGKSTPADDERTAKILEIDHGTNVVPKRRNLFHSSLPSLSSDNDSHTVSTSKDSISHQAIPSPSSEVQSFGRQKLAHDLRESCYYSSQLHPVSSKGGRFSHKGPVTPTKSDGSKSCLSGCSDSPSYMSCTESSKAKIRSVSAPRQRPQQYERSTSMKRYSVHSYSDSKFNPLRVSGLQANFDNKAYPGSGCLDRLGMPVGGGEGDVFSGGHRRRV